MTTAVSTWAIPPDRAERQALLVRAADQEARRQAARERGDLPSMHEAERELERLWRRFAALGDG